MMYLNLTRENLDRIVELLRQNCGSNSDKYLISYLETIKKNYSPLSQEELDEIPFQSSDRAAHGEKKRPPPLAHRFGANAVSTAWKRSKKPTAAGAVQAKV